jgi:hypothetical protein
MLRFEGELHRLDQPLRYRRAPVVVKKNPLATKKTSACGKLGKLGAASLILLLPSATITDWVLEFTLNRPLRGKMTPTRIRLGEYLEAPEPRAFPQDN